MSRSYPIWNEINSCAYAGNKSYGIKEHGELTCYIGTSASRSYEFFTHKVTHRQLDNNTHEYRYYVDNKLIKRATYRHKQDTMLITKYGNNEQTKI
tara:strand:- start:100 stop:387 length:288 start_codon:yes stop_codon:yes gene_type:complete